MRVFYSVHPLIASNILGPGATAALTAHALVSAQSMTNVKSNPANVTPASTNLPG
jgi:hypothetical protein